MLCCRSKTQNDDSIISSFAWPNKSLPLSPIMLLNEVDSVYSFLLQQVFFFFLLKSYFIFCLFLCLQWFVRRPHPGYHLQLLGAAEPPQHPSGGRSWTGQNPLPHSRGITHSKQGKLSWYTQFLCILEQKCQIFWYRHTDKDASHKLKS